MSRIWFYAAYSLHGNAIILSADDYNKIKFQSRHDFVPCSSFEEAKQIILDGIKCDRRMANDRMKELKKIIGGRNDSNRKRI